MAHLVHFLMFVLREWQTRSCEWTFANNRQVCLFYRFLHIAVAQGRRALAYVLAKKMCDIGMLDVKEHNQQVRLQFHINHT